MKYRCMACGQTWEKDQLINGTCGDACCGANVESPGMQVLMDKIRRRKEAEQKIKDEGGDKYQQIKARLTDPDTGQLGEDIVICAIRCIKDTDEARSFVHGFITEHGDPTYVTSDIWMALGSHFTNPDTHKLWNEVLDETVEICEVLARCDNQGQLMPSHLWVPISDQMVELGLIEDCTITLANDDDKRMDEVRWQRLTMAGRILRNTLPDMYGAFANARIGRRSKN